MQFNGIIVTTFTIAVTSSVSINTSADSKKYSQNLFSCLNIFQTISETLSKQQHRPQAKKFAFNAFAYPRRSKKRSKRYYRHRSIPLSRPATGRKVFIFYPRYLQWAAYDHSGNLVKTGRASGGRGYCSDVRRACRTPRGRFRVYSIGSPSCKSTRFPLGRGGAPMPYCTFFYRGFAIHGSPDVPNYNASHGCIRVRPTAARWLRHNFFTIGTTVIVRNY